MIKSPRRSDTGGKQVVMSGRHSVARHGAKSTNSNLCIVTEMVLATQMVTNKWSQRSAAQVNHHLPKSLRCVRVKPGRMQGGGEHQSTRLGETLKCAIFEVIVSVSPRSMGRECCVPLKTAGQGLGA